MRTFILWEFNCTISKTKIPKTKKPKNLILQFDNAVIFNLKFFSDSSSHCRDRKIRNI